jgi:hypothetical protein
VGIFRNLWNLRKQTKALRQMAEQSGVDTSLRGMLSQTPGLLSEASDTLQAAQEGKADGDRLRAEGMAGRARLLAVRDTGISLGGAALGAAGQGNPVADLDLEVSLETREPYRATVRQMVPRLAVGRLIPGSDLPVKVDRTDHTKLLVDWEAPLSGEGAP